MTEKDTREPILEVSHLKKWFPVKSSNPFSKEKTYIKAVDDVSFVLHAGETLGVVGESGCGKSTMGRSVLRLIEPTAGEIKFHGQDLMKLKGKELRAVRQGMQMMFQDPYAA